jgi:hypothetical protein
VRLRSLLFALPLLAFAGDALAWGLQTHLFFAQHLLLALPFADPQFRRAALRMPRLVLAGACLPDLSLAGRVLGTPVFQRNHLWSTQRRFAAASCDEERAIALGYASHLLADVVAHNRFVPEHERRIAPIAYATHALCEWAMDDYVRSAVFAEPADLLEAERSALSAVVARRLRCSDSIVRRAIELLARAERVLRKSRLPRLCGVLARRFDHHLAPRFEAYTRETASALGQLGPVLDGIAPEFEPEPSVPAVEAAAFAGTARLVPPASLS